MVWSNQCVHCYDARTSDVTTPTVTIAHPNLSGHLTFDEQYALHFHVYLLELSFTVVTDCNSLRTAFSKKDLIPRVGRWWLQVQEFTFDIKYRPGSRMPHVDALS
jgi:hypothetical protein